MSESPNDKFKNFLKSFDELKHKNHWCFDSITEISRKDSGDRAPLIHCRKKMYSLDDIKDQSDILKDNRPRTADALWYREDGDNLILYLIEFKFHNLDDPDPKETLVDFVEKIYDDRKHYKCLGEDEKAKLYKVKQYYGDDVNHALVLKPLESIKVVIPKLYEEYCNENPDVERMDIETYLNNIEKRYFVFVSTYTREEKLNDEHERAESRATHLEQFLDRLIDGKIIDHYDIWPRCDFEDFLKLEQLVDVEYN